MSKSNRRDQFDWEYKRRINRRIRQQRTQAIREGNLHRLNRLQHV